MPRLRRSDPSSPGIRRARRGRGLHYTWSRTGDAVDDPEILARIEGLVIPPAWQDVWICPWPNGHIQAVGTDAAGRRQYLYHEQWRKKRDEEKYARAVEFGLALPRIRQLVEADLALSGLGDRRILAAAVRLLDIGAFRIGSEAYAREHETFGIATLLKEHVRFTKGEMTFSYPAKGSIPRTLTVNDPGVEAVLRPLKRRRSGGEQLLAYKRGGQWVDLHSADINAYIKDLAGEKFSAKDFRTWSGTVFTAVQLALVEPPPRSRTARRRAVVAAIKEAAEYLGNTPAVCRSSYIDPRIVDFFEAGTTIELRIRDNRMGAVELRELAEQALLQLLSEGAKEQAA